MACRRIDFRRLQGAWRRDPGSAEEPSPTLMSKLQLQENKILSLRRLQGAWRRIGSAEQPYFCPAPVAGEQNWFRRLQGAWRRIGSAEEPYVLSSSSCRGTDIDSEGCRALGEGLAQLKNLTSVQLQLQENKIGSKGCRALGEGLAQLKNLTSVQLQLQENKIGSEGCRALGARIGSAEEPYVCPAPVAGERTLIQKAAGALEKD